MDDWLARDNVPLADFAAPTAVDEADEALIALLAFLIPITGTVTECVTVMEPDLSLLPVADADDAWATCRVPVIVLNPEAEVLDAAEADMVD